MESFTPIPQAWICPRCDAVNAPHVNQCNCRPVVVTTTGTEKGLMWCTCGTTGNIGYCPIHGGTTCNIMSDEGGA